MTAPVGTPEGDGPALITGASAGIGAALAREFASNGHDVVLVARREERLQSLSDEIADVHGVTCVALAMDLTDEDAPERLFARLEERGIEPAILVNNVGIGAYGRFGETDRERERRQLRLNVEVLVALTHRFLAGPPSRARKVLNVGSIAGLVPGPYLAGYYASKAYVNSFSQALAAEYRDDPVDVTVVCPGPVATEFQDRAGMDDSSVGMLTTTDPEHVAEAAYEGLEAGKAVVIPGLAMKVLVALIKLTPRVAHRWGAELVNRGR